MASDRPFTHLHVHSEYSLLDGACRFDRLVSHVKANGMDAIALTDHGNLFGAISFMKACKAGGIKPIIGCELYVAPHGRHDRTRRDGEKSANHLLLLAKDYQGYINLCKLSSIGYLEGFYSKPRVDHEVLSRHSKGLIATSSCLAGEIPQALVNDQPDKARALLKTYLDIFGEENFYLEVQDHGIHQQQTLLRQLIDWNRTLGLPLLATNDCHYTERADSELHDLLLCIQTKATINDTNRFRFPAPAFYVKTPQEMYSLFAEIPEACLNTAKVAEQCHCEIPLNQTLLPHYPTPDGMSSADYLRKITIQGLQERYPDQPENVVKRVDYELSIINTMGFASYFLIVWDFIDYARRNGISVGPGRGSAAGSVVAYCLKITDVDPVEHNLLFERFLNPERVSMPDIDIDFCFENRGRVIDYVKSKYGESRVAQIITFGTQKPKNAIKDVARALDMPASDANKICAVIPTIIKTEKNEKPFDALMRGIPEFRQMYETDANARKLIDIAKQMEGMTRHASTHAAGIIISDRDLTDLVPLYKPSNTNDVAIQYTMGIAEEIGLLKMDFLGLKNLTIIDNCVRWVKANHGIEIDWTTISLNEPATYEYISAGNTFGVFQLESTGITEVVKRLKPSSFADMTALLALYRPGPIESGMVDDFVERKHGRREIKYDHPTLAPILKETYGTILYQEQVMQIAQELAGYSLGEADLMRRAMGKKKPEEMDKQRQKFIDGAAAKGIDPALAESIFNTIVKFAGYGFNKSHSAAYAVLSFRTAYLKCHYPVEYTAALMTNAIGGKVEDMADFFQEARRQSIRLLPPHVNYSEADFTPLRDGTIRFGLLAIRNVGSAFVDTVVKDRAKFGPYASLVDFCNRINFSVLNGRVLEALIKVGAFDGLGHSRSALLSIQEQVIAAAVIRQREVNSGQESLFDSGDNVIAPEGQGGKNYDICDENEKDSDDIHFGWEKEFLGHYVSGSPWDAFRSDVLYLASHQLTDLPELAKGTQASVVAEITNVTIRQDRNGRNMAWVNVSDLLTATEFLFFSDSFEANREHLAPGSTCLFSGMISRRNEEARLMVDKVTPVSEHRSKVVRAIELRQRKSGEIAETVRSVRTIAQKYPGRIPIAISMTTASSGLTVPLSRHFRLSPVNAALKAMWRLPHIEEVRYLLKSTTA